LVRTRFRGPKVITTTLNYYVTVTGATFWTPTDIGDVKLSSPILIQDGTHSMSLLRTGNTTSTSEPSFATPMPSWRQPFILLVSESGTVEERWSPIDTNI
jgi:hypothetical protein